MRIACVTNGRFRAPVSFCDECGRMIRENPYLRSLAPYIRILETPEETRNVSSTQVRRLVREIREKQEELRETLARWQEQEKVLQERLDQLKAAG